MKKKELLTLNKPIYVGCTVLELSKLEMYKFHYGFMKDNVRVFKLLYSDTDSFIYEIGENFYEIMNKHKEFFDLSNQPKDSKYYCNDNKKVPGKMKDEYGGTPIYEFIGLKSKMYSICSKNNEKSILKGHNSYISNNECRNVLQSERTLRHQMSGIRSKKHELVTYTSNKKSINCFDDKRYILSDGINTLPYGHKDILKSIKKIFFSQCIRLS